MLKKISEAISKVKTAIGANSASFTNVLIWKIGIIIFFAVTLKEFFPLLDDYRNNNVATQIKIIGVNESVKPPTLAFCIPWTRSQEKKIVEHLQKITANQSSSCNECDKMASNSWDVWRHWDFANSTSQEIIEARLSSALMSKLFSTTNDSTDFAILNSSNSDWNQPLIDAVFHYFWCLNDFDARLQLDQSRHWCFWEQNRTDSMLSDKSIIENLFSSFVSVLCDYVNIDSTPKKFCVQQLTHVPFNFYSQVFCFALQMSASGRSVAIDSSGSNGVWSSLNDREVYGFMAQPGPGVTTWPRLDYDTIDNIYESQQNVETVFIRYIVALTVLEKRPDVVCYQDISLEACKGTCFTTRVARLCGCVPFWYRNYVAVDKTKMPYCNTVGYKNCILNQTEEMKLCENKCQTPCEYAFYQWHVTQRPLSDGDQNYTNVNFTMKPISFPLMQFTTTHKMTWEQFLSQMGAVYNLYLGISGLSAITFVVYCTGLIRKRRFQKKVENAKLSLRVAVATVAVATGIGEKNRNKNGTLQTERVVDLDNTDNEEIRRDVKNLRQEMNDWRMEQKANVDEMKTVLEELKKMLKEK